MLGPYCRLGKDSTTNLPSGGLRATSVAAAAADAVGDVAVSDAELAPVALAAAAPEKISWNR